MFSIARTMYSACAFLTPAVRWETVADSPNPLAVKDKSILQLRVGLLALGIISSIAAASAWVGMPVRFAGVVLFTSSVAVWKLLPVIFKFESERAQATINASKNEQAIHLFKTTSPVNSDVMTTLMDSPSTLAKLVEEVEDAPKLKLLFDAAVNRPDTPSFHLLKPLIKKLNQNRLFMADNFDSLLKACIGKHNHLFVDILKENPIDGTQISEEAQFRAMAHEQMDDTLLTCLLGMGFSTKEKLAVHLFKIQGPVNDRVLDTLLTSPSALAELVEEVEDPDPLLTLGEWGSYPLQLSFLNLLVKKLHQDPQCMAKNFGRLLSVCLRKNAGLLLMNLLKETPVNGSLVSKEDQFLVMAHEQMDDTLLTCLLGMGFSTKNELAVHLFKSTDLISDQVKNTLMSSPSDLTQLIEDIEDVNKLDELFIWFLMEWRIRKPEVLNVLKPLIKKLNQNPQFMAKNWRYITNLLLEKNNRGLLLEILKENPINGKRVPEEDQFDLLTAYWTGCWMDDTLLKCFLEMGFNIDATNRCGRTPLMHWLIWCGNAHIIIERLLKFGATIPDLHTTTIYLPTQRKSTSLHKYLSEFGTEGQEILSMLAKTKKERNLGL